VVGYGARFWGAGLPHPDRNLLVERACPDPFGSLCVKVVGSGTRTVSKLLNFAHAAMGGEWGDQWPE
jgi:hypothetical protein